MPLIVETIVTTRNAAGEPHIAPLGLIAEADRWIVAPFRPSRTLDNLRTADIRFTNVTVGPEALLGTIKEGPLDWENDITETPVVGDTEIWRITNLTADAHPIHLHLVQFQVVDRTAFDKDRFEKAQARFQSSGRKGNPPDPSRFITGKPTAPLPGEQGWKDTVIAHPEMLTRIIARFDLTGLYVWHCHILEHEDNEMMRPYYVRPRP